jgi:molybdopterin-guanine dinucleotide biosynthesis protein A
MGRDKARLRLGRRTLLGHVRAQAQKLGLPVRIIRRDLVVRCGPLGGVYTGLKTSRAEAEIFLACDMPFVSPSWLQGLIEAWENEKRPIFTAIEGSAGFPFVAPITILPAIDRLIAKEQFALQRLATALNARLLRPASARAWELMNVNTPEDWQAARERWRNQPDQGYRRAT